MPTRCVSRFAAGLLAVTSLLGQMRPLAMSGNFNSGPDGIVRGTATFNPPLALPALPGAPYSGQQVSDSMRTLPDGTHVTTTRVMQQEYRDSSGRTRLDRLLINAPLASSPAGARVSARPTAAVSQIVDWSLGVAYILDSEDKVAYHLTFEPIVAHAPLARPSRPAPAKGPYGQQNTTEDLGTSVIDGVPVMGRRMTSITPAGARGNDRPIVSVTETWQSVEQGLTMLQKTSNDNQGTQSIVHYANFSLSVPDPSLFAPPPDYKIVEEQGSFTVTIGPPVDTTKQPRILAVPLTPPPPGVH